MRTIVVVGAMALAACGDEPSDGIEVDATSVLETDTSDSEDAREAEAGEVTPEVVTPTSARCDEAHDFHALGLDESVTGVVLATTPDVPFQGYPGALFEVDVPTGTAAWAVLDWPAYLDKRCVGSCRTYSIALLDEACQPLSNVSGNFGGSAGEEAPDDDRLVASMRIDGGDPARTFEIIATGPQEPGGLPYRVQLLPMRCYMDWPELDTHAEGVLTVDDPLALVTMDPPGRVEAFHVALSAGEVARFEVASSALGAFSTILLHDPECRTRVEAEAGVIEVTAATTGTYTLELVAFPFSIDADGLDFAIERVE